MSKTVTLTNTAPGARGIAVEGGSIKVLEAGETAELTLDDNEYKDLPEHFMTGEKAKKAAAEAEAEALENDRLSRAKTAYEALDDAAKTKAGDFEAFAKTFK